MVNLYEELNSLISLSPHHICLVKWESWRNPILCLHTTAVQLNVARGKQNHPDYPHFNNSNIAYSMPFSQMRISHFSSALSTTFPFHLYFTEKMEVETPTAADFYYHFHQCPLLFPAHYCRWATCVCLNKSCTWVLDLVVSRASLQPVCSLPKHHQFLLKYSPHHTTCSYFIFK